MSRITESAEGKMCMVRIPGICQGNYGVVFAHLDGGGMGQKSPDFLGAYCCYACHAVLHNPYRSQYGPEELKVFQYEGVFRTQSSLYLEGLLLIKGEKNGPKRKS